MQIFDDLLRIKGFREQSAANAVTRAKAVLEERLQAVRDAEQAVEDYREFRVAEEVRLFQEIKGAKVKVNAIEVMKQKVGLMRDHELKLIEEIEVAKQAVEPAREAVAEAEQAHVEAQKAVRKFEEFVDIQKEEELKIAAYKEEAEVEEISEAVFSTRMREAG